MLNNINPKTRFDQFSELLPTGVVVTTGAIWKQHRAIVQPIFHRNVLTSFVSPNLMQQFHLKLICLLFQFGNLQLVGKNTVDSFDKSEHVIEIQSFFTQFALEMLMQTIFGVSKQNLAK